MKRLKDTKALSALRARLEKEAFSKDKKIIKACCGTACMATGAAKAIDEIEKKASEKGVEVEVVRTGCQGLCQKGPVMLVEPSGYFYQKVRGTDAGPIVDYSIVQDEPYRQSLYRKDIYSDPIEKVEDIPFYKMQERIALRKNGLIDPTNINHYIALGGYSAIQKALDAMTPEEVMGVVDDANLRGRGGAGFPAGKKWIATRDSGDAEKFIIANGDEGDPGAFMDRAIMEGDPHALIEGMALSAYAVGSGYGMIYVRHEYPLAVRNLKAAIAQAEEFGFLGKNILGTDFSFTIDIREGAGAFVCGESTALIASIEGERGFPRTRTPRPSEPAGGAWGYASNINNIETFVCVPPIIENGSDWFKSIGTEKSPGTKVFALTGKVKNTGLVEVPMGISLREIIFDIGGGILDDKSFKAVQTGGPSGGCIPEKYLDMKVDFDSLWEIGSMMGSGGMVVMDEETCMVDMAKFFLAFTQSESCGKCPPCRLGTHQMLKILERITSGNGSLMDLDELERIGKMVQKTSLCGLGQGAPLPVLSTLKHFRHEYEEHVNEKYCSAGVCKGLGVYVVNQEECVLCGECAVVCAFDAVKETRDTYFIDEAYCTKCKACYEICPTKAIKIFRSTEEAESILSVEAVVREVE